MPLFILCPFVDVMHFLCSLYVSVVVSVPLNRLFN